MENRGRARARPFCFGEWPRFGFLWESEKDAEIAEIVAGGSRKGSVAEVGEEGKGIAVTEEILRHEAESTGTGESGAIRDSACGGGIAVDAVGSSAQDGDGLAGDFLHAGENECRIPAADSLPCDRAADFAVGN